MKIRSLLAAVCTFSAFALGTGVAAADFVCNVGLYPGNSGNMGTEGYVQFQTYTGANCTGSFVGTFYACSTSATSSSCPSGANWRYERQSLLALYRNLQSAASVDQKVSPSMGAVCNGGAPGCMSMVYFYSN